MSTINHNFHPMDGFKECDVERAQIDTVIKQLVSLRSKFTLDDDDLDKLNQVRALLIEHDQFLDNVPQSGRNSVKSTNRLFSTGANLYIDLHTKYRLRAEREANRPINRLRRFIKDDGYLIGWIVSAVLFGVWIGKHF